MRRLRAIVSVWAASFMGAAHAECVPAEILRPPLNATIHESRPDIGWTALPGVRSYRVQVESRVPEGQVIERIDARVNDTHFVPPRALANRLAAVKVLVTADCPEATSIAPRAARFSIDLAPLCPAVQGLTVAAGKPAVEWTRVSGATRYEVETYSAAEGTLIVREETTRTSADLPRDKRLLLIAVRARCESFFGEAAFAYLPGSR